MKRLPPLVVIVGPTAAGKTDLAITLAEQFDGEIVSADSRQVYRGLDLGTGKVTVAERARVPHHLIDIVDPQEQYSVAEFQRDALASINDILARGRQPFLVGGTGLYVRAIVDNLDFPKVAPNEERRHELASLPLEQLQTLFAKHDPAALARVDTQNPRRLIRAIEVAEAGGALGTPSPPRFACLQLGIRPNDLDARINDRLLNRLDAGMVKEVRGLLAAGLSPDRLDALGLEYRAIGRHLSGQITYQAMVDRLAIEIRQYAKRQMTWFKRDERIRWISDATEAAGLIKDHVAAHQTLETA